MIQEYIDSLVQAGKVGFSSQEAQEKLGISKQALAMAISRLRKKGTLISPYRDFYVPLPPEYRALGCLPANQLIPPLMKHIQVDYYMCLLSAAAIHGATHQRPQITQVMLAKRMRPIRCGSVAIDFIYKKELSNAFTQLITVPTGYLKVSTPETTAMDLLHYPHQSGGINHIATVLTELIDAIEPEKLLSLARVSCENAWVQRLGYILEKINPEDSDRRDKCALLLKDYIQENKPSYIPLVNRPIKGGTWDKSWRVVINTKIESDI